MHPRLRDADLDKELSKKAYKQRTKENQVRLVKLQRDLIKRKLPVVVVFEGWDAAGKGGTIHRMVHNLDPRIYRVHAISKPTPIELAHHYLWRFWTRLPERGELAVFDRSWYGRVMVERVEGFAQEPEWRRAYDEINHFEKALADDGHLIIKFFLHISKDEQKRRFESREKNPLKQWKMNAEDYRNRKRWDDYATAVDEMFAKTHTRHAPWILVPANDKRLARMICQDRLISTLERALKNGD
jgi:PPK2 family polyphosphate:nucleotide phosphotransferase